MAKQQAAIQKPTAHAAPPPSADELTTAQLDDVAGGLILSGGVEGESDTRGHKGEGLTRR